MILPLLERQSRYIVVALALYTVYYHSRLDLRSYQGWLWSYYDGNALADNSEKNNVENATKKPNILFILADDVGTGDIPYYWKENSLVSMPNIDNLSAKGVTFMDAHSTPLCAPSRYMLLSGNYPYRGRLPNGSWNLNGHQFSPNQKSIAEVLRDGGGYNTAMFGKWHLGARVPLNDDLAVNMTHLLTEPRHDWSRPLVDGPQDIGFDTSYITTGGIQSDPYVFFKDGFLTIEPSDSRFWKFGSYPMPRGTSMINNGHEGEGSVDWDSSAYNMILVNETTAFIEDHLQKGEDDPFFAYVALGSVHTPHSPPDRYLDGDPIVDTYETKHMDLLLEMDKVVGSLVTLIEEKNLAQDTIIIFASDNGGGRDNGPSTGHYSNGPLRGRKGMIYEGGHRVPMIFRYDNKNVGFPAGEDRHHMVGLNDIFATLCELTGIEVPYFSAQDSVSFANYISDDQQNAPRQELATSAFNYDSHAIRFGNLKLIYNATLSTFELYDLDADMNESNDLLVEGEVDYDLMRTMQSKLIEVGPCPKTQEGQFVLSGGDHKNETVTCQWFQESKSRCHEHLEGRLNCNGVCGNAHIRRFCRDKFPTITFPTAPFPTTSSLVTSSSTEGSSSCSDLTTSFEATLKDGTKKIETCEWVRKESTAHRCHSLQGASQACPSTCTNCCVESVEPFQLLESKKTKTCAWAAEENTKMRCGTAPTRQLCPITCGICN